MGFNRKCLITPHATLRSIFNKRNHLFWLRHTLVFLCTSQTKDRPLQKNLEKQKFYIYGALSLPSDFRTKKKKLSSARGHEHETFSNYWKLYFCPEFKGQLFFVSP